MIPELQRGGPRVFDLSGNSTSRFNHHRASLRRLDYPDDADEMTLDLVVAIAGGRIVRKYVTKIREDEMREDTRGQS
jgi:hypothetical protein